MQLLNSALVWDASAALTVVQIYAVLAMKTETRCMFVVYYIEITVYWVVALECICSCHQFRLIVHFFWPKLGSLNFPRVYCPACLICYRKSIFNAYTVRKEKCFCQIQFYFLLLAY